MKSRIKSAPAPSRRRLALGLGFAALAVASTILLSRSRGTSQSPAKVAVSSPSSAASTTAEATGNAEVAASASSPALAGVGSSSPTVAKAEFVMPAGLSDDALRKVQMALGGSARPTEMLEAATVLQQCEALGATVERLDKLREQQDPDLHKFESTYGLPRDQAIKLEQAMQRRCQVFDAATYARRGELLKGAYEGGAKDAALPYLIWANGQGAAMDATQRAKLQRDARQAAEDGDLMALLQLGTPFSSSTLGTTEVQRQAYREAQSRIWGLMLGPEEEKSKRASSDALEKSMAKFGTSPPLTPQEQREADALAAKVVEAWRKKRAGGA